MASKIRKKICVVIFLSLVGCDIDRNESLDISWLYDADPVQDAKAAIERKDYRFVGVYGYSLRVPRVEISCLDLAVDVRPIEGTSDASMSYEEKKFNAVALIYADHYNFQLMSYLEDKSLFKCKESDSESRGQKESRGQST